MPETTSEIAGSILPMSKQQAMILLESVYLWMDLGKFDHARELAAGAAALMPKTKQVQLALGTIEFNQQKFDKALQAFRSAQRLDPKSALARAHCGEALLFMGKTGEALKELQAARDLEDDGGVPEFTYSLALFAGIHDLQRGLKDENEKKRTERFELAVKAFELAAKWEPERVEPQVGRGDVLIALGKPGDALGAYSTAAKLVPDAAEPRLRMAQALLFDGKADEAKKEIDAALMLSPTDAEKDLATQLLDLARGKVKDAPKKR